MRSPDTEWTVSFQQDEIQIGRGGDTPLDIKVPDPTVSRCHGRIWVATDGFWFEDNNSTHGSKKNDSIVMGPVRIFSGDTLKVGESFLTIEQADITEQDSDLDELFDVHVQDRLHLHHTPPDKRSATGKIKVVGRKAYYAKEKQADESKTNNADIFGNLVNIFGYEQLSDSLSLATQDIIKNFTAADRGCILLFDEAENELIVSAHYPLFDPAVSTTLARKVMEEQQAFIWEAENSSFTSSSLRKMSVKSGMYSPLGYGGHALGVITAETTSSLSEFKKSDLTYFVNLSQVLSSLIYSKQKEEA